jgi:hypothetical protein
MTPFQQYVKIIRQCEFYKRDFPMGHRKAWTRAEEHQLVKIYPELVGQPEALEKAFPGRSYAGIKMKVQKLGIQRSHKSEWE